MPRAVKTTESVNKRAAATPRISKEEAEKFLAKAPEDKAFWCVDGRVLRDMGELRDALGCITDQTFAYHSNAIKKDFSAWVRDVIGDEKLAGELEGVSNREQAARIVEERYAALSSKAVR